MQWNRNRLFAWEGYVIFRNSGEDIRVYTTILLPKTMRSIQSLDNARKNKCM